MMDDAIEPPGAARPHEKNGLVKALGENLSSAMWRRVPSGMRLEFGGAISGNMRLSFQAARSIG